MIREAIAHVASGATLSEDEAALVMEEIMTGVATQAQMGAFLTALRLRPGGETVAGDYRISAYYARKSRAGSPGRERFRPCHGYMWHRR